MSSALTRPFAPGTTTIVFSPLSSTVISATPVETDGVTWTMTHVQAFGRQPSSERLPEGIVTDAADHRDIGAQAASRHGLVRALAARRGQEGAARDRLARLGEPRRHAPRGPC